MVRLRMATVEHPTDGDQASDSDKKEQKVMLTDLIDWLGKLGTKQALCQLA